VGVEQQGKSPVPLGVTQASLAFRQLLAWIVVVVVALVVDVVIAAVVDVVVVTTHLPPVQA
jgi:hypothetical protein